MGFKCKRCGKCCQSYWITMLPQELSAMACELKVSEKYFVEKYCVLLLQLFPYPRVEKKGLIVARQQVPEKLLKKIDKKLGQFSACFIVLPSLALKRKKETCVLLEKSGNCLVHASKPGQCSLFPFISLSENPNFAELYSFCLGLAECSVPPTGWDKSVAGHYANFSKYFEAVQENGFKQIWKHLPKEGVLLAKNNFVCRIKEKEFFKIIKDFS